MLSEGQGEPSPNERAARRASRTASSIEGHHQNHNRSFEGRTSTDFETPREINRFKFAWVKAVMTIAKLTPTQKIVAFWIADFINVSDDNRRGLCWASIDAIAARAGCKRTVATDTQRELKAMSMLKIDTGRGRRITNRLSLCMPADAGEKSLEPRVIDQPRAKPSKKNIRADGGIQTETVRADGHLDKESIRDGGSEQGEKHPRTRKKISAGAASTYLSDQPEAYSSGPKGPKKNTRSTDCLSTSSLESSDGEQQDTRTRNAPRAPEARDASDQSRVDAEVNPNTSGRVETEGDAGHEGIDDDADAVESETAIDADDVIDTDPAPRVPAPDKKPITTAFEAWHAGRAAYDLGFSDDAMPEAIQRSPLLNTAWLNGWLGDLSTEPAPF